jgi:acyl-CoA thioester hydrolase
VIGATFRYIYRVPYSLCTVGNHIYYSRYLDILEAARGEFFRHLGATFLNLQEQGVIFPVIEARVVYRGAARYDDLLTIELWLTDLRRVRIAFNYRVLNGAGRELTLASTMHACTSLDDKPEKIPESLAAALRPYLHAPPQSSA